ncbi:MAG: hypothetical protein JO306_09445, partial [Gemmatimonadetes bacterium]|nr:hypothetical protein [Gemmatimonadota bacterium]
MRTTVRRSAPVLALLVAAACRDLDAPAPALTPAATRAVLTCTVRVRERAVDCGRAGGPAGARADLILGRQNVQVRLASANTAYDAATDTFRSDITVQNLLAQAIGTRDDSTVNGVKVFYADAPAVTGGTGSVTVANADGTGTFLASNQAYYAYPEILQPQGTSAARTWKWVVDPTVSTFAFRLYVTAPTADESAVVTLTHVYGTEAPTSLNAIWAAGPGDVFAVQPSGQVQRYDGTRWRGMRTGTTQGL